MIELLFLGTGAADWDFSIDGNFKYDNQKRIRKMSSLLIDEKIVIDPAPESFNYAVFLGCDISNITDVFITHTHSDHYNKNVLINYAKNSKSKLRLWAHEKAEQNLNLSNDEKRLIEWRPLKILNEVSIDDISVMPLIANHTVNDTDEKALHYVFNIKNKNIFYGPDGAWLLNSTWDYLLKKQIDAIILDATVGDYEDDWRLGSHNSIPMIRMLLKSMYKNKVLKSDSKVILSHLAKTLHEGIIETEEKMAKENIIVAYDGMRLEI